MYLCLVLDQVERFSLFSERLTHLKFSSLSSVLSLLIWSTSGLLSGLGKKAKATSLPTLPVVFFPSLHMPHLKYPSLSFCNLRIQRRFLNVRTRPRDDASYPSNPGIGFHSSILLMMTRADKNSNLD